MHSQRMLPSKLAKVTKLPEHVPARLHWNWKN